MQQVQSYSPDRLMADIAVSSPELRPVVTEQTDVLSREHHHSPLPPTHTLYLHMAV